MDVDEGGRGGQRLEGEVGEWLGAGAGIGTGLGQLGVETAEGKLVAIGSVPVDTAVPLIAAVGGWRFYLGEFDVGDAIEAGAGEIVGDFRSGRGVGRQVRARCSCE